MSFLSTKSNPVGDDHVNRKQQDGSVIQVPTIPAAVSYNKNMGERPTSQVLFCGPQITQMVAISTLVFNRCEDC